MKKFLIYFYFAILLAIGGFCLYVYNLKKVKIYIAPNRDRTFYQPDTSIFVVPVSLSVKDMEQLANLRLKQVLLDKKLPVRHAKDTLHLKIKRAGNVRFRLQNNLLSAHVPLYAEAFYTLRTIGKKSKTFFEEEPVNFLLEVLMETPIVLNDHYGFNPHTTLKGIEWKMAPMVKIGPIKKDIREQVEKILAEKQGEIGAKVDSILRERITLKKPLQEIWRKMQRPVLLNLDKGAVKLYLHKQPLAASVWLEPDCRDSLHFLLRLKGLVYILQARDTLRFEQVKLPRQMKILRERPSDDTTRFHIQVALPLSMMENICNRKLAGKKLKYAGYLVKLKKVHLENGQHNMLVSLRYKGDFTGEVRMKGTPELDLKQKSFNVTGLEFESRDDNVVLGSAEKVFHGDIRDKIKESVQIDLRKAIDTIPALIRDGIGRSKLSSKAEVVLDCFEIKEVKTNLTMQYVHFMVSGSAQVKMNLKKEAVIKKRSKTLRKTP